MIRTTIGVTCVAVLALLLPAASASAQSYQLPVYPPPTCTLAKVTVSTAQIQRGAQRLVFRGGISPTASGRVNMTLRAGGGTPFRFRLAIKSGGRISGRTVIPPRQAKALTGTLTIAYPGDSDTCAQTASVRAGIRTSGLSLTSRSYSSATGRLRASGRVSRRARGSVQLQMQFISASGSLITGTVKAPIKNGRWSYSKVLPALFRGQIDARTGPLQLSVLYLGSAPARLWGQIKSVQLLAKPA